MRGSSLSPALCGQPEAEITKAKLRSRLMVPTRKASGRVSVLDASRPPWHVTFAGTLRGVKSAKSQNTMIPYCQSPLAVMLHTGFPLA